MKSIRQNCRFTQMILVVNLLWMACFALPAVAANPPIADLAFAHDGKSVFTVSQSGVQQLEWPSLKELRALEVSFANLHCVALSPNGKRLAVGGGDPSEFGVVEIFSWPAGEKLFKLGDHTDSVTSVVWKDNGRLFTGSLDRTVMLCDVEQEELIHTYQGHSRGVTGVGVLETGPTLLSVGQDQSLRVWESKNNTLLRSLSQHTRPIHALAQRPQQEGLPMVATASKDRTIRFWQPTIGRMMRYVRLESEPLDIVWTQRGEQLVAACVDGQLHVVDPVEVTVLQVIPAIDGWAYAVAAHPSDGSVLVAGANRQVRRIALASE